MTLSYKEFIPSLSDGKLNKYNAMLQCVNEFKTIYSDKEITVNDIHKLGKILSSFFCVYSNIMWSDNHRKKENSILKTDLLIFDIDDGMRINEVLENCKFLTMILTTSSHTEDHHKFRVFIPLKEHIEFKSNNEYKEFLKLFGEKYLNDKQDKSCLEAGRAYITIPESTYKLNDNTNLFETNNLLKETKNRMLMSRFKSISLNTNEVIGQKKYTISEVKNFKRTKEIVDTFKVGNHHKPVYQIMGICKKSGLTNEETVRLILTYNLPKEYSNFDSLLKKVKKYE